MAEQLKLPEPVLSPLVAAARSLPEGLPIEELTEPETAAAAWKTAAAQLPAWQEDNGMAQLAVMLAAVCRTEKRYRRMKNGFGWANTISTRALYFPRTTASPCTQTA